MKSIEIVKTVFLKAPPHHVWRFLTEKDKLAVWFHEGETDLRPGGDYGLLTNTFGQEGTRLIAGKVIEFDPPRRLVHTFTHHELKNIETLCAWDLIEAKGGTILVLTHTGWEALGDAAFNNAANHDAGWDEHMIRLRRVTQ